MVLAIVLEGEDEAWMQGRAAFFVMCCKRRNEPDPDTCNKVVLGKALQQGGFCIPQKPDPQTDAQGHNGFSTTKSKLRSHQSHLPCSTSIQVLTQWVPVEPLISPLPWACATPHCQGCAESHLHRG